MLPKPQISASRDKVIRVFSDPNVRNPPCETCYNNALCEKESLACNTFYYYAMQDHRNRVNKKELNRIPNRIIYNDIFADFVPYDEQRHGE